MQGFNRCCDTYQLNRVVHSYASTANFKGCWDSSGADTKKHLRAHEVPAVGTATTAGMATWSTR